MKNNKPKKRRRRKRCKRRRKGGREGEGGKEGRGRGGTKIQNYNKFSLKISLAFACNSRIEQHLQHRMNISMSCVKDTGFIGYRRQKQSKKGMGWSFESYIP